MSLFKRGGTWWSYIFVNGVRHARSTKTGNRRLAEQIDQKHREELLLATEISRLNPQMSLSELCAEFYAHGEVKDWHRERLKILLRILGSTPIGKINKALVSQYRRQRLAEKAITQTTVNRDIECLRHILYWAADEGILATNPIARVRLERERRKKKPVLSFQEEMLLLPNASSHLQKIIILALGTGMRRGEILHQRWEDVDFARRLLYVTHSKTPEGESREIPFTQRVFNLLSMMRKDSGLLFALDGKPIHSLKTGWKAAIRRAGIRYIQFHYLRHTFNTRLLELGVTREVRMALLGHTFGDTHESYEHVELPLKRDAIRRLDEWFETEQKIAGEKKNAERQEPSNRADAGADCA